MNKTFVLLLLSILTILNTRAQSTSEIGISGGVANYLGDIGGKELTRRDFVLDLKWNATSYSFGTFFRRELHPRASIMGSVNYSRIQGADSNSTNPGRVGRNLSFRNDIIDFGARIEWNIYVNNDVGNRRDQSDCKIYLFGGVSGFFHKPKAFYNGSWVELQPLTTEMVNYSNWGFALPVGLGFYYTINRTIRLGWEIGWHYTFTDYLDDISTIYPEDPSQLPNDLARDLSNRSAELSDDERPHLDNYEPGMKRGDPTHNDNYLHSTIKVGFIVGGKRKSSFYKRKYSWLKKGRRKARRIRL